jgi:hypothetical protein
LLLLILEGFQLSCTHSLFSLIFQLYTQGFFPTWPTGLRCSALFIFLQSVFTKARNITQAVEHLPGKL